MHARKQSDDLRENSKDGSEENEELEPTVDSDKINRLHAKGQQGLAKGGRSFEEVHKAGVVAPPGNVDNKNKSLRDAEVELGQKKTEKADDGNDTKVEAKMRTQMQRANTSLNTNKNSTYHKERAEGERLAGNINVTRHVNGNVNESEKSTDEDNRNNSDKEDDKDNDNNKEEHNGNNVGKNSEKEGVSTDIKKQGERMKSMTEEQRRKIMTYNSTNVKDGLNEAIKKGILDVQESHEDMDPSTSEINLDLIADEELESSLLRNQMSKRIENLEEVEEEENVAETQPSSGSTLNPLITSPPDVGDDDVHEHLHNGVSEGDSMSTVLANEKVAVKEEEEEENEDEEDVGNELNAPRSLTLVEKARALGLEVSITSSPSLFITSLSIQPGLAFHFSRFEAGYYTSRGLF